MQHLTLGLLCLIASACAGEIRLIGKPVVLTVLLSPEVAAARRFELRVNGVASAPGQTVLLRLFADFPNANRETSVDDARFVGYLTKLPSAATKPKPASVVFSISAGQRKQGNSEALALTIVPMNDTELSIGSISTNLPR